MRGMGVEHQILTLNWDEKPHEGKVQVQARLKRYGALLEACQERDIRVLMTGHHHDDQLGEWCVKLCMCVHTAFCMTTDVQRNR